MLYVRSIHTFYILCTTLYNLGYYSLLYSSTRSILDYALINQLASSNSSLSSHSIVLKASVILKALFYKFLLLKMHLLIHLFKID